MSALVNDKPFPLTVLDFDPFEGDFGTNDDKVFSDKMVVGRKRYQCFHCHGPILVGEQHRYMASKFDDEFMTHRFCAACCEAMLNEMKAQHGWDEPENEKHLFAFEGRNGMHVADDVLPIKAAHNIGGPSHDPTSSTAHDWVRLDHVRDDQRAQQNCKRA